MVLLPPWFDQKKREEERREKREAMAIGFNSSPKKREAMAMVKRKRQKDNTDRAEHSRAKESE